MHVQGRQGVRRWYLALLVVTVALVQPGADSASAAGNKRPDFGPKEGFEVNPDDVAIGEATTDHGETSASAPETVAPTVVADRDEKRLEGKAKAKRPKSKKRKR